MAWENISLMLASSGSVCLSDDPALNPPKGYEVPFHPGISDDRPSLLMEKFIIELTHLLVHPWVLAQVVARDALGTELTPNLFHVFFDILDLCVRSIFLLTVAERRADVSGMSLAWLKIG